MAIVLEDDGMCFVCGKKNDKGLKLEFRIKDNIYTAKFIPEKCHQGFSNIMHGGIISAILDEAMAGLAYRIGMNTVSAGIEVKFKKPAMVGDRLSVKGEIVSEDIKVVKAKSMITKEDGTVIAEATGTLVKLKNNV